MCEICRRFICPSSCPSYDGRSSEYGRRIGVCRRCGEDIYRGEAYFFGGRYLCEKCRAKELLVAEQRRVTAGA